MNPDEVARQLQDTVLTPLAAVAARLDSVMALTQEPQVQRRIGEVAGEVGRLAGALRAQVRDLQRGDDDGGVAGLRDLVLDAGQRIGTAAKFAADAGVSDLPPDLLDDLTAVLREALDNVVRHAYAGSLEVTITSGAELVVSVRDDGVGPNEEPTSGTGLARLSALAEARGGTSGIAANTDGFGSTFTWSVPR